MPVTSLEVEAVAEVERVPSELSENESFQPLRLEPAALDLIRVPWVTMMEPLVMTEVTSTITTTGFMADVQDLITTPHPVSSQGVSYKETLSRAGIFTTQWSNHHLLHYTGDLERL